MSLFKILKGDSSRISTGTTPFHDGWCYFTSDDGGFYIDSLEESGEGKRTRINPESQALHLNLTADGWKNNRQVLDIEGLRADQNGIIGLSQDVTSAQMEAAKNAELYICDQFDGILTIAAFGDVPGCDIPVVVILIG